MDAVCSSSSLMSVSLRTVEIAHFADLIIDSNTPPKSGVSGGFQSPGNTTIRHHALQLILVQFSD